MKLVLASASPRRRELLEQVGLSFQVIPSNCEEICCLETPEDLVADLAKQKAENVASKIREQIQNHSFCCSPEEAVVILGSDTVVAMDGRILGKPKDEEDAFQMLQNLQGKKHQVYSGVALSVLSGATGEEIDFSNFYVKTEVEVYAMTEEEIWKYIATGEPMDKAGGYGIQGRFAEYIKGIVGDYYNVVGLPVSRVMQELKKYR